MKIQGFLVLIMATGLASVKFAYAGDILFIDLNNAISEVEVVQAHLGKPVPKNGNSPSQLVVVPSFETFNMDIRKKLEVIKARSQNLMKENLRTLTRDNDSEIFRLGKASRELLMGDPDVHYTPDHLLQELEQVVNQRGLYNFDHIFISGHHGSDYRSRNGFFGGEFVGGVSMERIKEILNLAPTTENVRTLALLGCNTGINKLMASPDSGWSTVLPQAVLHIGFNGYAPIKSDQLNLQILRQILSVQDRIAQFYAGEADFETVRKKLFSLKTGSRNLGFRFDNQYHQHPRAHFVE